MKTDNQISDRKRQDTDTGDRKTTEGWEKEFEEKFPIHRSDKWNALLIADGDGVKDFISNLLSKQREQMVEEIEKMKMQPRTELVESVAKGERPFSDSAEVMMIVKNNNFIERIINKLNKLGD